MSAPAGPLSTRTAYQSHGRPRRFSPGMRGGQAHTPVFSSEEHCPGLASWSSPVVPQQDRGLFLMSVSSPTGPSHGTEAHLTQHTLPSDTHLLACVCRCGGGGGYCSAHRCSRCGQRDRHRCTQTDAHRVCSQARVASFSDLCAVYIELHVHIQICRTCTQAGVVPGIHVHV